MSQHITIIPQNRDLTSLFQRLDAGNLKMDSLYQRPQDRWDKVMQSRLVESILTGFPIPPLYLASKELHEEVVDGKQRLSTLYSFFKNKFKLRRLEFSTELNGCTYSTLPEKLKKRFLDQHLPVNIIPTDTEFGDSICNVAFARLNTSKRLAVSEKVRGSLTEGFLLLLGDSLEVELKKIMSLKKEHVPNNWLVAVSVPLALTFQPRKDGTPTFAGKTFSEASSDRGDGRPSKFWAFLDEMLAGLSESEIDALRQSSIACMRTIQSTFGEFAFFPKSHRKRRNTLNLTSTFIQAYMVKRYDCVAPAFLKGVYEELVGKGTAITFNGCLPTVLLDIDRMIQEKLKEKLSVPA